MVGYRRILVPGGTSFFTVALADRGASHLTDNIDLLRNAFRKARGIRPFTIDAIVVLPDHLHAILTLPEADTDFVRRWRGIKAEFTRSLLQRGFSLPSRDKTGRALWQRRFWQHVIMNDQDFSDHVDYIHYNPVKHGHTQIPSTWPYSSLHRYIQNNKLPPDWSAHQPIARIAK